MIDLLPTPEQQEVADSIAAYLVDALPVERHRGDKGKRGRSEHEQDVWKQLADLGCFGLSLPEQHGGIGLTLAEDALAFREYGRHLVSPAILGTVLAAKAAAHAGQSDSVAALLSGERRAGVAIADMPNTPAGQMLLFDVRPQDLVAAWNDEGLSLFEAKALGPITARTCIDASVTMASVDAPGAKPLVKIAAGDLPLGYTAAALIAAMLCGITEAIRDMAVEQAKTRQQFGQIIGTFQAVKHKCADIGMAAELAWCQTVYAALSLAQNTADAPFHASNAKMISAQSALDSSKANIQLHGGMGFTAELNAHLFLKRAHVLNELGGSLRDMQKKVLSLPVAA